MEAVQTTLAEGQNGLGPVGKKLQERRRELGLTLQTAPGRIVSSAAGRLEVPDWAKEMTEVRQTVGPAATSGHCRAADREHIEDVGS